MQVKILLGLFIMCLTAWLLGAQVYAQQCTVKSNGDYICDEGTAPQTINPSEPSTRVRHTDTDKYKSGSVGGYEGMPNYTSGITVIIIRLPGTSPSSPTSPGRSGSPVKAATCAHCDDPNRPADESTLAAARDLVKAREGMVMSGSCHKAYKDTGGKWTIGYGHLIIPGDGYSSSSCISDAEANALLDNDLTKSNGYYTKAMQQAQAMGKPTHCMVVALTSVNYQRGIGWQGASDNLAATSNQMKQGDFCGAADTIESGDDYWHKVERGETSKSGTKDVNRIAEFGCALRQTGGCGSNLTSGNCSEITFKNRAGQTHKFSAEDDTSVERFRTQIMFREGQGGNVCTTEKAARLLQRMMKIQDELNAMGHDCSSMVFDAFSTYRPSNELADSRHGHCDAMDFRVSGVGTDDMTIAARKVANREGSGGVGFYGYSGGSMNGGIHVDVRDGRVDWGPSKKSADCQKGTGGPLCGQYDVK